MNARQRKKYLKMGVECDHRHYVHFMVTDDPYPIYDEVDKCKLGKFHVRHGYSDCCFSCKHYTLSKKSMGEAMERVKDHKLYIKECEKMYH